MAEQLDDPLLAIRDLDVRFGDKTVLSKINLDVFPESILVVTGPSGSGKSTLIRAIAGSLDDHDQATVSGEITYRGGDDRPGWVRQTPARASKSVYEFLADSFVDRNQYTGRQLRRHFRKLLKDHRMESVLDRLETPVVELSPALRARLRILSATLKESELICLDEPVASLDDDDAESVISMICRASKRHSFIIVTHHQRRARHLGDQIALLSGGRIIEQQPVDDFFETPETSTTRQFVETGNCSTPSVDSKLRPNEKLREGPALETEEESDDHRPTITYSHPTEVRGPRGFRWLLGGKLGTSPIPGAFEPIDRDLEALERIGVTLLVTLTEDPLPRPPLEKIGFETTHFPIVDTKAPAPESAAELCGRAARWLHNGGSVVFHCRAGRGRAGTLVCSMLIWADHTADCALKWARTINDNWVQSDEQEQFLHQFQQWLADNQPRRPHRQFDGDSVPLCSCQ